MTAHGLHNFFFTICFASLILRIDYFPKGLCPISDRYYKSSKQGKTGITIRTIMRNMKRGFVKVWISCIYLVAYHPCKDFRESIIRNFCRLSIFKDISAQRTLINCTVFTHILIRLSFPVFYSNTFNEPGDIFATYAANICYICFATSFMANEPSQMTLTIRTGAFPAGTIHIIVHAVHLLSSSHLFS